MRDARCETQDARCGSIGSIRQSAVGVKKKLHKAFPAKGDSPVYSPRVYLPSATCQLSHPALLLPTLHSYQRPHKATTTTTTTTTAATTIDPAVSPIVIPSCPVASSQKSQGTSKKAPRPPKNMTTTLNYFDLPGRAEATRIAFAIGGVEFKDKRLSFEEFIASPFNHLPVLQMNGTDYTQSTALLRYAGKLSGLYPKDALAALRVDEIVMAAEDCNIAMFSTMAEHDPEKQLTMRQELSAGKLKTLLEGLAAKLAANKSSPYFVGDSLTIADLQVYTVILTLESGFLEGFPTTLVSDVAPTLKEFHAAVLGHSKVKAYNSPSEQEKEGREGEEGGNHDSPKKHHEKRGKQSRRSGGSSSRPGRMFRFLSGRTKRSDGKA